MYMYSWLFVGCVWCCGVSVCIMYRMDSVHSGIYIIVHICICTYVCKYI